MKERSMHLPADVAHLAAARDFALRAAHDLGAKVDDDDLLLIVGELAANAVVHQRGDAELVVRVHPDGRVDIEVADDDPTLPGAIVSGPLDPDGHRGLQLVQAMSDSWGVTPRGGGKLVWAHLAPPKPVA